MRNPEVIYADGDSDEALASAIEAASTHLLADAWDEGFREGMLVNPRSNPYGSQK